MTEPAPLHGLRIIDLTSMVLGPYATQILADYGADVVKIEPPRGDLMRTGGAQKHAGMGALFLQLNRNKRSVVLDLKQPAARAALLRLCATPTCSSTTIARRRCGGSISATPKYGRPIRELIYVSLFGYGETGPYAGKPAYDDLIQGAIGLPALAAEAGGGEPRYVPLTLSDRVVGI